MSSLHSQLLSLDKPEYLQLLANFVANPYDVDTIEITVLYRRSLSFFYQEFT